MSEPTWGEVPALLYDGIGAFIDNPGRAADTGDEIAAAAAERVRGRRRVRITRSADAILATAQAARAGIAFREDTHFHAPRGLPALRARAARGGSAARGSRRDRPAGRTSSTCGSPELAAIEDPRRPAPRCEPRVLARKKRRASFAGAPLISPATLYPHRDARGVDSLVAGTAGRRRAGIRDGAGRARPAGFASLRPGEVLVCPYTNPSWTPLFERAAAVVVDTGGLASHAAIVAREYGIPAVMGTGTGTRVLRDGDIVMVDGDAGQVREWTAGDDRRPPHAAVGAEGRRSTPRSWTPRWRARPRDMPPSSMDAVAERARVSKASLYRRWQGKSGPRSWTPSTGRFPTRTTSVTPAVSAVISSPRSAMPPVQLSGTGRSGDARHPEQRAERSGRGR